MPPVVGAARSYPSRAALFCSILPRAGSPMEEGNVGAKHIPQELTFRRLPSRPTLFFERKNNASIENDKARILG